MKLQNLYISGLQNINKNNDKCHKNGMYLSEKTLKNMIYISFRKKVANKFGS